MIKRISGTFPAHDEIIRYMQDTPALADPINRYGFVLERVNDAVRKYYYQYGRAPTDLTLTDHLWEWYGFPHENGLILGMIVHWNSTMSLGAGVDFEVWGNV